MKRKQSMFKQCKISFIIFCILCSILSVCTMPSETNIVSAAASTEVQYYKDVTFSFSSVYSYNNGGSYISISSDNIQSVTFTNIHYNTSEKKLSYDIKPDSSINWTNNASRKSSKYYSLGNSVYYCVQSYSNPAYAVEQDGSYGNFDTSCPNGSSNERGWTSQSASYTPPLQDLTTSMASYNYTVNWSDISNLIDGTVRPGDGWYSSSNNYHKQFSNSEGNNWYYWSNQFNPDGNADNNPKYIQIKMNIFSTWAIIENAHGWDYAYGVYYKSAIMPLIPNNAPNLTLTSQNNQTLINFEGLSGTSLTGSVSDPEADDVLVEAEIPNVFYKTTTVTSALPSKSFSIPMDVLEDGIPPGTYTITFRASDPSGMASTASLTINVKQRLRNKAFILVNTAVDVTTTYTDFEGDTEYARRYKYVHDPGFFDNPTGVISDSGQWRSSAYTTFAYPGSYVASFQAQDNPKNDDRFVNYRNFGRDNLSGMTFMVHRRPIALFTVINTGSSVQYTDLSYDLDHTSDPNKGLIAWEWQYKLADATAWSDGQLSGTLTANYDVRLRVRDIDGESGAGVWSDWKEVALGDRSANTPPVALFTATPAVASYKGTVSIVDKSFDPDNDPLIAYAWYVTKNGTLIWSSGSMPSNLVSYGVGTYVVSLQVKDSKGAWSDTYSQTVIVINNPPAAAFTMPPYIYRDTVVTLQSLSENPDADGDALTFQWNAKLNNGANHYAGSNEVQTMTIRDLIARDGISQIDSVSEKWQMQLTVSDGSQPSYAVQTFEVLNHSPVAAIAGQATAYQYDTGVFSSASYDDDTADNTSLSYYWKISDPEGGTSLVTTSSTSVIFTQAGIYKIEHWVVDQIGARSNIASLEVAVSINQPPTMTITSPTGNIGSPSVLLDDPNIKWTYSDPENDLQSQFTFEFFGTDGVLKNTILEPDPNGAIREYQVAHGTFERFTNYYFYGRSYSKYNGSDQSNSKAFIIDNPPVPGFTMITDTGRNAAQVPIYRTDVLKITGTATDADIPKGDSIPYKYYLKPEGGSEGLASAQSNFTKQFTTNGSFTFRQVVTDSLGIARELSQTITVANRIPTVSITYPSSSSTSSPTVVSTLTPVIKWEYQDEDGDLQQRYKVRIINLTTGAVAVQSGEQTSSAQQWQVPAGALVENQKYAVEVEAYDGFNWSNTSPRNYFMVNLLTVKGGVEHTEEWNKNRQAYNIKKSGTTESPRGYSVFWAGEQFILRADATGLPDTIEVVMSGGYRTELTPTDLNKTRWTGELYDSAFEKLPAGPLAFTFTARNEFNTKTDTVTVTIMGDWSEYFQSHRVK